MSRHADVTVVVTNYNYGEFLPEAIDSALAQTGGPPRVVVVDDGSTEPHTLEVLDRLPAGVELIRQANAGLAAARNAGIRASATPYAIVLDADDRLRPGALDALRAPLDAERQLGFTYGITHFFGDWEGEMSMPPYDPYKLLYRHTIGSTCLMRRALFDAVGGFDPEFRRYEDWEFWLHALEVGWRGRRVEEITFDYRRHGQTMLADARSGYHRWYRRLRTKHAALYARQGELAAESDLGVIGRAVYRWWWGARPLPGRVEHLLHTLLFGVLRRARPAAAPAPPPAAPPPSDAPTADDVERLYTALLGRPPRPDELEEQTRVLPDLRALVDVILASEEYALRVKATAKPASYVNIHRPETARWTHPRGLTSDDDVAIVGDDGWLFLHAGTNDNLAQYLGQAELEDDWLERWQAVATARAAAAAELGARYLGVVVPDKLALYHQHYPVDLEPSGPRPIERLLQAGLDLSYPLDALRAAAAEDDVSLRTDTHLSLWGNYQLYRAVMAGLDLAAEPILERVDIVEQVLPGDLGTRFVPPIVEVTRASRGYGAAQVTRDNTEQIVAVDGHIGTMRAFENPAATNDRTLVVFGDSYGFGDRGYQGLAWFLAQSFRRVHFVWAPFGWDHDYAVEVGADITICQTAERFLIRVPRDAIDARALAEETVERRHGLDDRAVFSEE